MAWFIIFGLLMILCMILYPLKPETMLDIRQQLEDRRGVYLGHDPPRRRRTQRPDAGCLR